MAGDGIVSASVQDLTGKCRLREVDLLNLLD